jgi:hypothetical protein
MPTVLTSASKALYRTRSDEAITAALRGIAQLRRIVLAILPLTSLDGSPLEVLFHSRHADRLQRAVPMRILFLAKAARVGECPPVASGL